ncbi:hypothetical protein SPRG_09364 [Saprolegnia parasitica CBS 223.65]|uniref:Uncharacterized protein n=1 Tax=Saprolegnia parasitica (strain CBS 223.65) TaxID=695850 RepID=A0A067CF24_SAPPC|nr:hypothetical protein SPRG_09364 [Saprolegnia parasitica CBS 223.65]KDO25422.1 hypothetical protein SPRG_09364 [Saprolegnia parasitica CBS 223.65]|eukprot:XP_012203849.1 hypothetical protein SPRG_09364 [Saprolegnia parasitica CBS 223.65]
MKRVRSDYHMFVPGVLSVARSIPEPLPIIASPRILELELPPSNLEPLTRSVAAQTSTPPETEETDVAIADAGDEDERAYSGVRTESEARLFQYFLARCPSEDFADIAAQWNALLHTWRAADCLEVRLATGLVTMTDVTLKTADHLAVHAAIERAIGPATSEASTKHQVVVGMSALASTPTLRKRQYLPCPHCGHKTRRHTKDLAETCELYQFYRRRNVATSNGYSFEKAIEDFAQQQDSEPEASSASYIV